MKISPMAPSAPVNPSTPSLNIRSLKMSTDATPGPALPSPEVLENDEKPSNSGNNDETKPVEEATKPISPQFAALAKQRRALQQEVRAFQEEKRAFEATKSQGGDSVALARLKSDPLGVLLEAGVGYDQLADAVIANQGNPEVRQLKAEIQALKEGVDKKLSDQEKQSYDQAVANIRSEAQSLVSAEGEAFELVKATDSVEKAVEFIEAHYEKTGQVLDVRAALQKVEDWLLKQQQSLVATKKMQSLFKPAEQPVQQQSKPVMRTLTNRDSASVPMTAKQRAVAAFYGTLKK